MSEGAACRRWARIGCIIEVAGLVQVRDRLIMMEWCISWMCVAGVLGDDSRCHPDPQDTGLAGLSLGEVMRVSIIYSTCR